MDNPKNAGFPLSRKLYAFRAILLYLYGEKAAQQEHLQSASAALPNT